MKIVKKSLPNKEKEIPKYQIPASGYYTNTTANIKYLTNICMIFLSEYQGF